mmetsp:Transcript_64961/g.89793  ORF Transcript_64961/g.89793 Transcript_64961/m.89793 type:complete len:105 (-) Transcript_64961:182-496(-)
MKMFKKVMDINFYGSVYVLKYTTIAMMKNKPINDRGEKGVVVFISSINESEALPALSAYGASKGSIRGLTMPMARELSPHGIRVVTVAPGWVKTPIATMSENAR